MATREDMTLQERIDAALELAERICAQCRPACTCEPADGSGRCPREQECFENWVILHQPHRVRSVPQRVQRHPATHLESGPQSEAQFEEQMRELYPGWGEAE